MRGFIPRLPFLLVLLAGALFVPQRADAQSQGLQTVRIVSKPDAVRAYLRTTDDAVRQWVSSQLAPSSVRVGLVPSGSARVSDVKVAAQLKEGVSTVIVVDRSGSMPKREAKIVEDAIAAYVSGMGPNDHAAIVAFSDRQLVLPFTNDQDALKRYVPSLGRVLDRHTHLFAALTSALEVARRAPTDFVQVLAFSDGEDETFVDERLLAENYVKARVPLYAFAIQRPRADASQRSARERFVNLALASQGQADRLTDLHDLAKSFRAARADQAAMLVIDFDACGVPAASTELRVDFTLGAGATRVAWSDTTAFDRHSSFGTASCRCASDADCKAPTAKCETATGVCRSCLNDADCDGSKGLRCDTASFTCQSGPVVTCSPACEAWQRCDAGRCVALPCKVDGDCGKGGHCAGGTCEAAKACTPACKTCEVCAGGTCRPSPCKTDAECREGCLCDSDEQVCREDQNLLVIYGSLAGGALLLALLAILLLRARGRSREEENRSPEEEEVAEPEPVLPPEPAEIFDVPPPPSILHAQPQWIAPVEADEGAPRTTTDYSLVIVGGRLRQGQRFLLREETQVGADPGWAHLVLNAPAVSGRHAKVSVFPAGTVWVEDVGSSNGTRVRDIRLLAGQRQQVFPGDIIAFSGDVELRLEGPAVGEGKPQAPSVSAAMPESHARSSKKRTIID